jgi:hypothetical protein
MVCKKHDAFHYQSNLRILYLFSFFENYMNFIQKNIARQIYEQDNHDFISYYYY